MKSLFLVLAVLGSVPTLPCQPPTPAPVAPVPAAPSPGSVAKNFDTGIAAYVNRDVITKAEVWKKAKAVVPGMPEDRRQREYDKTLLGLVEQKVIEQGYQRLQLVVPDSAVRQLIEDEKEAAGGAAEFRESIAVKGFDNEIDYARNRKDAYENWIFVQTQTGRLRSLGLGLRAEHVVDPTAKEVRKYYHENFEKEFQDEAQVKLHIMSLTWFHYGQGSVDPKVAGPLVLEVVGKIRQELATGADFEVLAKTYGDAESENSGNYGWHGAGSSLDSRIIKAAFDADSGALLDPIPFERGYFLVRVDEKKDARVVEFSEAQRAIHEKLRDQNIQRAEKEVTLRMIREAFIQPAIYKRGLIAQLERDIAGIK